METAFAALPPDVRKVFDLPALMLSISQGVTPRRLGHSPQSFRVRRYGKAIPHIGRQSREIFPPNFTVMPKRGISLCMVSPITDQ